MTETANLSYQEVKEILAIFFDLPADYIKSKIEQHQRERDAEHKADYSSAL